MARLLGVVGGMFLLGLPLFAKCPFTDGSTLVVKAPIGNLLVETTGTDSVEVQVNSNVIQLQENCSKGLIEITSNAPTQYQGTLDWKIVVPKTINLDMTAFAGNIVVGNSDGNVTLRTAGGSVTAGQIKGSAAIVTQGGSIKSGNIGGNAELRSQGGSLEVGDVAGNAEFQTAGPIQAGSVSGALVVADTAGGNIVIKQARGEVKASTKAGDISIGDAGKVNATTAGGNITSQRVRGPFQGRTERGDIRVNSAASSVEASTGRGNIFIRMVPEDPNGDLHVDLQSGVGDVTITLPSTIKATIDATVERPAFDAQRIMSDFPMNAIAPRRPQGLVPNTLYAPTQSQTRLNGGGSRVRLRTSMGKIEIRKN
jgi:DUF4097 and DUF4098 domain-containing protein YvlB